MIISHKHKFIFIKTEKTAGTSIEIALSKFCGDDDIITPITPEDEYTRRRLSGRGPQNYIIPVEKYSPTDKVNPAFRNKPLCFFNHASAKFIRQYIGEEIWGSYFKFCFERNPWDKVISWYFWVNQSAQRPSITEFIRSGKANLIRGFDLYTIDGVLSVDNVYSFEKLDLELEKIQNRFQFPGKLELPRAKGGYRKDRRHYRDILSEEDRRLIENIYAREIALFGYTW
jgi:hypothetical protein